MYSSALPAIAIGRIGAPSRRAIRAEPNRNGARLVRRAGHAAFGNQHEDAAGSDDRLGGRDVLVDPDPAPPDRAASRRRDGGATPASGR